MIVLDLANQWVQAFPCKTKTSQVTVKSLQQFLEPKASHKVIVTDSSLQFGEACENLLWNHCKSTPPRSDTNGTAERATRRVREGTSAILLQPSLDEQVVG